MKTECQMNKIRPLLVAWAIQKIENTVVLHDSIDLEFDSIYQILEWYGIFDKFSASEVQILKYHLLELSYQEELREAVLWAESEDEGIF